MYQFFFHSGKAKIDCCLILCLAVILDSIGLSSQSKRLPDDGTDLGFHRREPSPSSPRRQSPDTTLRLATTHSSASSQPPAELTVRARSRSPSLRQTFPSILGFRFEDLPFIRLRPHNSPNRIFELRRYVFPQNIQIGMRINNRALKPMPPGEQIVLSTPTGYVYAILGKTSCKHTILRAVCTLVSGLPERVKIDMNNGKVEVLTEEEIVECPVFGHEQITKSYGVLRSSSPCKSYPNSDHSLSVHRFGASSIDSGSHSPGTTHDPVMPRTNIDSNLIDNTGIPPLSQTFSSVLGYRFDDLASIRLTPHNNPDQVFELRKYTFPPDKPIGLRSKNRVLNPMPTGEQVVLSTSNGDVCAILFKPSSKHTLLRPIFTSILGISERVKINMDSGAVGGMTKEEMSKCPVLSGIAIKKSYRVFCV